MMRPAGQSTIVAISKRGSAAGGSQSTMSGNSR